MKRYFLVLLAFLVVSTVFARGAQGEGSGAASNYPNRPIEIVVPSNPGASTDFAIRLLAPYLEKHLGVPIVITNNKVSDGAVSLLRVKDTSPDGYTWGWWALEVLAQRSEIGEMAGKIHATNDYVWTGSPYNSPFLILAHSGQPYNNLAELAAYARANPNTVAWSKGADGGEDHQHIMAFQKLYPDARIRVIDGMNDSAKALAAIMGGHIHIFCDYLPTSLQMYKDGVIKYLAVGSDERLSVLPDLPTYQEQGLDHPISRTTWAFFGPKKMPQEIVDIFSEAVKKAAMEPEYQEKLRQNNVPDVYIERDRVNELLPGMLNHFAEFRAANF